MTIGSGSIAKSIKSDKSDNPELLYPNEFNDDIVILYAHQSHGDIFERSRDGTGSFYTDTANMNYGIKDKNNKISFISGVSEIRSSIRRAYYNYNGYLDLKIDGIITNYRTREYDNTLISKIEDGNYSIKYLEGFGNVVNDVSYIGTTGIEKTTNITINTIDNYKHFLFPVDNYLILNEVSHGTVNLRFGMDFYLKSITKI